MILCVFLTFSTVNAADLNDSSSAVIDSQSESSFTNLNEDIGNNIVKNNEDEDCVESVNELSNLNNGLNEDNYLMSDSDFNEDNYLMSDSDFNEDNYSISDSDSIENNYSKSDSIENNYFKPALSSINSDENSLKSTLSPSENTFKSIQNAINSAKSGDVIDLNGKTFTGNGTYVVINKTITIRGGQGSQKATLDAKKLSGIFKVTAANVKLINCNFINTNNTAVIFRNDNGYISNCDFKNNFAKLNSHLCVLKNCTTFFLENSNFYNGYCINYTNVAINTKSTTVRNCTFINNTVKNDYGGPITGAAIQIGQSEVSGNTGSVINCKFINNSAISDKIKAHAGALCFRPGIKVFNSTFINNYCSGMGGATTLHADGELFNCIFKNNRAGAYGGAISTGMSSTDISVNISSCVFENNTAPMGGAIQIKGNNVKVLNSVFNSNNANETSGGALFIMGNEALIINSTFDRNFAKTIGAGVLINGSKVSVLNSSFNRNIASFGSAVYVVGSNASLFSSNFTNHNLISGAVFIKGANTYVYDSNFNNNKGENGAAIYITGSNSNLICNNFTYNEVSKKGGAVYIEGSNANLVASDFLNNSAIPDKSEINSGLGGAIYIKGDNNTVDSSNFSFNTARNGSAIYTDGHKMTLSNTNFDKNQAWSYVLDSVVDPKISYFNQSDILINLTLIGGNNIANAIYNTASTQDIYFYNISYISSKGSKTTGENEIHPVNGAENSNNGSLLYQDDREDNQLVNVLIYKNPVKNNSLLASSDAIGKDEDSQDLILNRTFSTGILGEIVFNMSNFIDEPLGIGKYILSAKHFEDDYYKEIDANNEFEIVPIVDLAINITSSRVNIDFNKTVKYTIKVDNYGVNNATGAKVNAIIPDGLVYLSSVPSVGTYDKDTGIWDIGDLNVADNQTLVINVLTNKTGIIDFPVNISSNEDDSNEMNNFNNKSIRVLMADLSIDVKASEDELNYGDTVDWTITVKNNGPNNASKILVSVLPFEGDLIYLNSSNSTYDNADSIWEIPNLLVDEEISLVISTKVNSSNKNIDLVANVSSETFDPITSNNIDSDSVKILPLCDLIIKVNMPDDSVNYGDIIDLVVVVSNDGPDGANNVSVSLSDLDSLGLAVLNCSNESFDKDSYEWFIGDLDKEGMVSLTIPVEINTTNKTVLVEGNVESNTFELNKKNNYDSDDLTINPLCDLIIDIFASNSTVYNGDIIDLVVVVSNDGPDGANNVSVSLSDLDSLGLVILEVSDNLFNRDDYEWIIGDLDSGESVNLTLTTKTNRPGENITIMSDVETSTFEVNKENNLDNDSFTVLPACDLVITISPDNSVVYAGDLVNWIINVTNKGPDNASDVNVFNSLPEGLEFILSESSKGELENLTHDDSIDFVWKVGDLASNESAYLIISTNTLDEGLISNNASVNSSTFDLNESNNFDSSNLQVIVEDNSEENSEDNSDGADNDSGDDDSSDQDGAEDDIGEDIGDELPLFDYNLLDKNDSKLKSKDYNKYNSKNPIDFHSKKTGNPVIAIILSIFALFLFPNRKN